jgi:hypothetical protein
MGANPKKIRRWRKRPPTSKRISIELPDDFRMVVDYWWRRGKVLRFAAVLVRSRKNADGWIEICRYDTAHGFAHLDVLDERGKVINKIPLSGHSSYKTAITYAVADLKENYRKYWQEYEARQKP